VELNGLGIDVQVNIVGFAVDDVMLKETFREWARLGNGRYFDAGGIDELKASLVATLEPRFEILDKGGERVAVGTVDGPPVEVEPGDYAVRLLHGSPPEERSITLGAGEEGVVEL